MAENYNLTRAPLELFTAADVEPKEVAWLWYPYIPFGKVTLIQGDPGDGKSTFALNLAAILTRGDTLPFTEVSHEPMRVIYLNAEDDADDTVVPRFIKANGVRSHLIFISEKKQRLDFSDDRIREAIVSTGARACILDPLASYLGADVSMNLANEVRPRFEALIDVAKETGCAIIVIAHMNKMEGLNAKYRNSGSIDIVASVRSALVIGQSGDEPSHKVVEHTKSHEDRDVLLTDAALDIIEVARAYQEEHGCKGEYIFSTTEEALSYAETNILLKKYCKRLNILYRSSHKSRKTYISSLIDAGININTIRSYAGHADERTTYFNYCFDRAPDAEKKMLLEKALETPLPS